MKLPANKAGLSRYENGQYQKRATIYNTVALFYLLLIQFIKTYYLAKGGFGPLPFNKNHALALTGGSWSVVPLVSFASISTSSSL